MKIKTSFYANGERGGALLVALYIVGLGGVLLAVLQTMQMRMLDNAKRGEIVKARNQVGEKISHMLVDPDYMVESARMDADEGNRMLANCINEADGPDLNCVPYNRVNATGEYEMVVFPAKRHPYATSHQQTVCVSLNGATPFIECFLAGKLGKSEVGYNLSGDVGEFSAKYPLKAKVYMRPECPAGPAGSNIGPTDPGMKCQTAEAISWRYELTHFDFSDPKLPVISRLGTYPKRVEPIRVSISEILGMKCPKANETLVSFRNNKMVCECVAPYSRTTVDGPCELLPRCPPGSTVVGKNAQGLDICRMQKPEQIAGGQSSICVSTDESGCQGGASSVSCGDSGFASNIKMNCGTQVMRIQMLEGEPDDNLILKIASGSIAALSGLAMIRMIGLIVWRVANLITTGLSSLMGAAMAMGVIGLIAAAIMILIMLLEEPKTYLKISEPFVTCTYDISCSSFH